MHHDGLDRAVQDVAQLGLGVLGLLRAVGEVADRRDEGPRHLADLVVAADQVAGHQCLGAEGPADLPDRSEEHTSELQSLMRISYAVFCLKKKNTTTKHQDIN